MRLDVVLVLAVLLLSAMAACVDSGDAQASAAPPPTVAVDDEHGSITGTVTDEGFAPVVDAIVAIVGGPSEVQAATDEGGRYTLSGLLPGSYAIVAQKLGFEAASRRVDVVANAETEADFILTAIPVGLEARIVTLIGVGFFACGADTPVVTWGNLHACVWSEHKPNFSFNAPKPDLKGVLIELDWDPSSGLTSKTLSVSLQYRQVCDPFCDSAGSWGSAVSTPPVRTYIDAKPVMKAVKEDPMPLKSVTFPDRGSDPVVIVYQQRMTHYVTMFYGQHCVEGNDDDCPIDVFSAIPDA